MNLTRLSLTNYASFEGENKINFAPTGRQAKGRNITLIGGKNGAGKTSILEAIRLCLYGPGVLGSRVANSAYVQFLKKQINHASLKKPKSETAVRLEFDFSVDGGMSHFDIERRWALNEGTQKIAEVLTVRKDGRELDELEKNQWQDFINELIPRGVADFFFFDAEQIEKLMDEETDDLQLKEAIHALLNLDILRRLGEDLDTLETRIIRRNKDVAPRLKSLAEREEALLKAREVYKKLSEEKHDVVKELELAVKELEQTIFVEGKSLFEIKGKLKQKKIQHEKELQTLRGGTADIIGKLLPFAIAKSLTTKLLKQIESERGSQRWEKSKETLAELLPAVVKAVEGGKKAPSKALLKKHQAAWEKVLKAAQQAAGKNILHNFNESDADRTKAHIKHAHAVAAASLRKIEADKLIAYREMKRINGRVHRIDKTAISAEMEHDFAEKRAELAREMAAHHAAKEAFSKAQHDLDKLHREKEMIAASTEGEKEHQTKIRLCGKVTKIIDRFFEILFAKKLEELAKTTTEIYASLARKKGFIKKISFSHETLKVTLKDRNGNDVPRSTLSAGEKQMLAVSILWALGRVSGKKLPIVIDTPLARLDSDHRDHFVLKYLPKASHQVVVLSTDTEIDKKYSEMLKDKVVAQYLLDYDVKTGATKIKPGYFFGGSN